MTQEESFRLSRYERESARRIFLNSGIDSRHFYFDEGPRLDETSDELNARYLRGALQTGCALRETVLTWLVCHPVTSISSSSAPRPGTSVRMSGRA